MVSLPPAGIASRALTTRFTITCSICPGSALHASEVGSEPQRRWLDVLADQALQHLLGLGHDGVEVEHLRLDDLLAAEREQLLAVSDAADSRRLAGSPASVGARRVPAGSASRQQVAVAEDGGQQVVEVVGDTAGQLADGFHLLRLQELGLDPAALGDVLHDDQDGRVPAVGEHV